MNFAIENLRPDKGVKGRWRFSVVFLAPQRVGFMRSHGWKYIPGSDRVMKPTGGRLLMTTPDDATLGAIRVCVKNEIKAFEQPFSARSAIRMLKDYKHEEGTWDGVFKAIKKEIDEAEGKESVSAWICFVAAACLAEIEETSIPKEVQMNSKTSLKDL